MGDKIIVSVLTALITAAALWFLGFIGRSTISLTIPSKAIMSFNLSACPSGWSPFNVAQGRYIVGASSGSNVGAVVGAKLKNEESRPSGPHTHEYTDSYVGGSGSGVQGGGSYPRPTGNKVTALSVGPEGTNAPYVQLLMCERT